jgi:hypothetical protein
VNLSDEALLATLSMRLLLEFEPNRYQGVEMEKLVAGHMRVAYSVPAHCEYMRAGSPSEPILAEAAAQVMKGGTWFNTLSRFLGKGLIKKGERGELVARLLLTLAHDAAAIAAQRTHPVQQQKDLSSFPNVRFSIPIRLVDFLSELIGTDHIHTIFESRPDNIRSGSTFREVFEDAYIHFTHFAKAIDSCPVSDDTAWRAMCRGMCFQCSDHQPDIDIVLPIILNKEKPLCRTTMSAIMIQVKNRQKHQCLHIDAERLGFFTSGATDGEGKRPYITLIMNLGIHDPPSPSQAAASMTSTVHADSGRTSGPVTWSATQDLKHHPRYAITITGCSSSVYKVIGSNQTDKYAMLLASRSLFEEHPQQQKIALGMVHQTKPVWSYGSQFQWSTEEPVAEEYAANLREMEDVVVAKYTDDDDEIVNTNMDVNE